MLEHLNIQAIAKWFEKGCETTDTELVNKNGEKGFYILECNDICLLSKLTDVKNKTLLDRAHKRLKKIKDPISKKEFLLAISNEFLRDGRKIIPLKMISNEIDNETEMYRLFKPDMLFHRALYYFKLDKPTEALCDLHSALQSTEIQSLDRIHVQILEELKKYLKNNKITDEHVLIKDDKQITFYEILKQYEQEVCQFVEQQMKKQLEEEQHRAKNRLQQEQQQQEQQHHFEYCQQQQDSSIMMDSISPKEQQQPVPHQMSAPSMSILDTNNNSSNNNYTNASTSANNNNNNTNAFYHNHYQQPYPHYHHNPRYLPQAPTTTTGGNNSSIADCGGDGRFYNNKQYLSNIRYTEYNNKRRPNLNNPNNNNNKPPIYSLKQFVHHQPMMPAMVGSSSSTSSSNYINNKALITGHGGGGNGSGINGIIPNNNTINSRKNQIRPRMLPIPAPSHHHSSPLTVSNNNNCHGSNRNLVMTVGNETIDMPVRNKSNKFNSSVSSTIGSSNENGNRELSITYSVDNRKQITVKQIIREPIIDNIFNLRAILVGNLCADYRINTITEIFQTFGSIVNIKQKDNTDKLVIEFEDIESPRYAISCLSQVELPYVCQNNKYLEFRFYKSENQKNLRICKQNQIKTSRECYFWRTTGCQNGQCKFFHNRLAKGVDYQEWMKTELNLLNRIIPSPNNTGNNNNISNAINNANNNNKPPTTSERTIVNKMIMMNTTKH